MTAGAPVVKEEYLGLFTLAQFIVVPVIFFIWIFAAICVYICFKFYVNKKYPRVRRQPPPAANVNIQSDQNRQQSTHLDSAPALAIHSINTNGSVKKESPYYAAEKMCQPGAFAAAAPGSSVNANGSNVSPAVKKESPYYAAEKMWQPGAFESKVPSSAPAVSFKEKDEKENQYYAANKTFLPTPSMMAGEAQTACFPTASTQASAQDEKITATKMNSNSTPQKQASFKSKEKNQQ